MVSRELPRVCVIGAGSSGLAVAKVLHERGIPFDCYEKGDRVGGNWVFGNKNGMSSAYRGLYINTSRDRMAWSDFPMPASYPDFPHHTQIAAYFEAYVDHFGFRHTIQFETGVEHVARGVDGVWTVRLEDGRVRHHDAVCVANGHHWDPRWPDPPFPGHFNGRVMHAHDYKDHECLRGERVVVLGMGNSAMDIAVESSYVADRTFLAARRGAHILPKYVFGKPIDQLVKGRFPLPLRARQALFKAVLRLMVGKPSDYGLPEPDHEIGQAHPTVSGRILDRLAHGAITPKPNLARLEGDSVRFVDGTVEQATVVIYCTGYKVTFPFFDEDFVSAPENDLPLYKRVFEPAVGGLFFVGLLQPLGAIMPLAEVQSQWIAAYLKGEYALPSEPEMREEMARERAEMRARYVASPRHTMQVDFDEYLTDLQAEMRRGKRRVRAGQPLPIPPRASGGGGAEARAEPMS